MYNVTINNPCSCTIKRAIPQSQSFDTKEEAQEEADRILDQMNNEFCRKHRFELKSEFGHFTINVFANR
ncbi:MAG: hypothetical protein COA44_10085 [Arcobacter sp.]|nr:MAG: hypothetical protein COA44_10085 [Arcobacter sp.]